MINCMIDVVESARSGETLTKLSDMVIKKGEGFAEFIKSMIPADIPAGKSPVGYFINFARYVNNSVGRFIDINVNLAEAIVNTTVQYR